MRKIFVLLFLVSFYSYSQSNRFTGTWSNENCKDCNKKYIFKINIAQSNSKIYGSAEITSENKELNSGVLEITGTVDILGQKAQIKIKAENGQMTSAVLFANDTTMQFNKRGGTDIVPDEVILTKLYE